jgi:hypothetical protein
MKVSILVPQNVIIIDGKGMYLDCRPLRSQGISLVQWNKDHGDVEYAGGSRPNGWIKKFDAFKSYVDRASPFGKWPWKPLR